MHKHRSEQPPVLAILYILRVHGSVGSHILCIKCAIQYLILTLTVYLGIILLIALATIAIQFLLRNSYFSFIILILLNMALFLGAYYSNVTFMNVILRLLNRTNLYITSGAWFMENDITLSFAGNEFWIIGVTGVWMILCVKIARNFKLYDRNVSSIHKNIKKDRCTK